MDDPSFPALAPVARRALPFIAAIVIGGAALGYAVHEHHNAQTLAAQNQQVTAQLTSTQGQLQALTAKVNALVSSNESKPSPATPAPETAVTRRAVAHRVRARAEDPRFKKLQSQLDAQGKAIDETRSDLASARTELTGSIARTHDELVVLEKKGERNYIEFDLSKSKEFKREGPISISLRKANTKHQFADLALIVDDRNLSQKHVNLYQPAMFYEPDAPQPIEVVINDISKNHIHGYVSAPKYRKSELAAMSGGAGAAASGLDQATDPDAQPVSAPAPRQKLPVPTSEPQP
jgi:hypothetical protein